MNYDTLFSKRAAALAMVVLLVVSAGGAVAQASMTINDPGEVNYESDAVHNPGIGVTLEKDTHQVGWGLTQYEGNSGELVTPDARVNDSEANPVGVTATDINFSDAGAFPRYNETHSALDASEWSTTTGVSVADTTTAPNVDALNVATNGSFADGDSATATYALSQSIDSDEAKRSLQLFADVNTLDAGAHVEIRVVDEDSDYKTAVIDPDNSTDADHVLANATGEGYVLQHQLGEMSTTTVSGSDGTFDNIQSVEIVVEDGDADVSLSVINSEKLGEYTLGEQRYDSDDDGEEDETRTITEPTGQFWITGVDTMGDTFSNADIAGMEIAMIFDASSLDQEMDAHIEFTDDRGDSGVYPGFQFIVDSYYRLSLPSAYDVSYSNAELTDEVELPSSRYQTVEYAEGVSDTEFDEISSWSSVKSSYDSQGDEVTLDSTIQPGTEIALHYEYVVTGSEKDSFTGGGAGPGQFGQESGGWLSNIPIVGQWLAGLMAVVGSVIGGKWAMGK
ncbi:hypothetical protein [Halobaculum rubrum]|uniref:hypothetical protein n=1 Tax=Halobaculum rubrum TaxID=2872158 RepID=UPI001CA3996A|nr:hypothetical protein [Halobaculum rubrum]QZX98725.1 hypothetical protein K6T25_10615 [Halobaculum rubrum]